ncbi:HIRAN domain-containing protein [Salmonella enterica]|uniref:Restriction endonuclease n=1 Tax=Salmonella enteritidis TaxID=149539 RepID=A0A6Y1SL02_SALEN|nr:HIRAN domain-containing protein [Salmonella enterica]EBR8138633.1 restriction endonuclease [Salmonella enterica subsp. enterica serovar Oranienburg]ECB1512509.1 restriction endonuclease [Salmonella enterica subsp. enterica serovar Angoda]ECD4515232.1 restriction endonuclease [Salmonella enterica subsp. enterica serovar Sandiego]HAB4000569.1 restriction endonuclease [Salmonella enterica subsp. enterica serovar Enteritidis]ECF1356832.1 restriction endonuclease [Salmonella enterica subsp. ente
MTNTNSVYVAWQAPDTRDWHVVGNLQERNSGYVFKYTKGALKSAKFTKFSGMTDVRETYVSEELFPLFKNRLLSPRRPEYPSFIKWLGLEDDNVNPIDILARSGGLRSTDQLQIFKKLEVDSEGRFEHFFFLHGLSYLNPMANERVSELKPGQILRLCLDLQNEYDGDAVVVRADKPAEIIGYCPRYLCNDIKKMLLSDSKAITLTVEKISDDAPHNYRLLCKLSGTLHPSCQSTLILQDEFEAIE